MSIIENKQLLRTSHDVVKLLRDQNIALRKENKALLERVSALEAKLGFLAGKKNLLLGLKGERLVSELVEGQLTSHTSGFDVVSASGYVFECKYSSLGIADRSKKKSVEALGMAEALWHSRQEVLRLYNTHRRC